MADPAPTPGTPTNAPRDNHDDDAEDDSETESGQRVCLIACRDLIGYSRLAAAARAAGYHPQPVEGPQAVRAASPNAACVIVDLKDPAGGLASVRAACHAPGGPPVFAVGPHVDAPLLDAAREAGCSQVYTHATAAARLPLELRALSPASMTGVGGRDPDRRGDPGPATRKHP